jgi:branched-chain amino acid aminotransferase
VTKLVESVRTVWDGPYQGAVAPGRHIPFGSSSVQHGAAVFEGVRCYAAAAGPALFRLDDHLLRLLESARLLGLGHDYDLDRLRTSVLDAAASCGLADCYVRPGLFAPDPYLSIDLTLLRITLGVEIWPMGGARAHPGIRLTISPWRRPSPRSFPPRAKAVGMYATSALAKTAAVTAGYDDAVQLDPESGRVAEATTSNIFLVRDGRLITPWLTDSLLAGITRDTVLALAGELGIPAGEEPVEAAELAAADEVFLTGTAGELVPAASLDGRGYPGERPVFDALSAAFRDAVTGHRPSPRGWLTPVPAVSLT